MFSYVEGFVFMSAGLFITLLTTMMLSKRSKDSKRVVRGQVVAVPRSWGALTTPPQ